MSTYIDEVSDYIDLNGGLGQSMDNSKKVYEDDKIKFEDYKYRNILPGHFYLFEYYDYELAKSVREQKSDKSYYNFNPFVFAFKSKNEDVFGMDINGLHPILRKQLFSRIARFFESYLEYNSGKTPLSAWRPIMVDSNNYFRLINLKNKSIINNYDRKKIKNLRIMRWEDIVPASMLYFDENFVFNRKKQTNLKTLFNSQLK